MSWIEAIGYVGTVLVIAFTAMTTIIPLRIVSLCASAALITYGFLIGSWPVILTELFMVPLNAFRLWQMWRLVRSTGRAAAGDLSLDWLRPFGTTRLFRADEVVFRADDPAGEMYYIEEGVFRIPELGIDVRAGGIVGELGLLSPGNTRTASLVCVEAGRVLSVTYSDVKQLYYQNPEFGFYFLKLTSERLFQRTLGANRPIITGDIL